MSKASDIKIHRLSVLILCCIAGFANAQTTTANINNQTTTTNAPVINSTVTQISTEKENAKPFSLSTYLEYSQKVEVEENAPRGRSTDLGLSAGYKINDLYTATGIFGLSYDLNGPKNTTASDATVGLSIKGYKFNEQWNTTHALSGIIPISDNSKVRDRLRTSLGISNGVTYTGDRFTAKYRLTLSKNIHEFTQNADGTLLNEYRFTNSFDLIVPLTDKFSITTNTVYRMSLTYENNPKYSFGFDGDLNYDFTDKIAANLGMSNEGNALKANGTDSNINIYDEASSVFRTGISYVY